MRNPARQFAIGLTLLIIGAIPTLFALSLINDTGSLLTGDQYRPLQGLQLLAFFVTLPALAMAATALGKFGGARGIGNLPRYLTIWAVVFAVELAILAGCVVLFGSLAERTPPPRPSQDGATDLAATGAGAYNLARIGTAGSRTTR